MTPPATCDIQNIGPRGRRRRAVSGVVWLLAGLALAAPISHASLPWHLVLLVPFTMGALGLLQAREKT